MASRIFFIFAFLGISISMACSSPPSFVECGQFYDKQMFSDCMERFYHPVEGPVVRREMGAKWYENMSGKTASQV